MKKHLAILLTLSLIISVLSVPVMVSADTAETVYYYNDFSQNHNGLTVKSNVAMEVSGGNLIATVSTTATSQQSATFDFITNFSNSSADRNPLVLEYRVKLDPRVAGDRFITGKNGNTYGAWIYAYDKYMTFSGDDTTKYYFDEETNMAEWHTVSVVYSPTANTRDFYWDGSKVGTSKDSSVAKANSWDSGNFKGVQFIWYSKKGSKVNMDYLKVYEASDAAFTAEVTEAGASAIVLKFNQTPGNISESMFTLSDGTAIKEIDMVDPNTYKLTPETNLIENTAYTLDISSELKTTVGKSISTSSLTVTPKPPVYVGESDQQYFNSFNADELGSEFVQNIASSVSPENAYVTIEDGAMKMYSKYDNLSSVKFTPDYENTSADKQPLVLEYKVRFDITNTRPDSGRFHHSGTGGCVYGIRIRPARQNNNYDFTEVSEGSERFKLLTWNEGHTISIVYSNTDNTKDLYIDGAYIGTSTPAGVDGDNYWDDQGKLGTVRFDNNANRSESAAAGKLQELITYMDYLKVYEVPENFGAQVLNAQGTELNEIYVDFNSTVSNIDAGVLTVNGKAPLSIELDDEEDQIYKLTLSETLKPNSSYQLSLNGVANMVGQTAYNDISFTTRAPEGNEVFYDISGNGTVKDAHGNIANGTLKEAQSISLIVKPNVGYEAVVKVNNETVSETSYGLYNITVTDGAYIDIDFNAVSNEAVPQFTTPFKFVEGDTSYTFVRLNVELPTTDFGVIVSSDQDKLSAEDVDGVNTFMLPATNGSNSFGEYGIAINDSAEGNVLGNTYYVRPYAVFNGTYYYQTPVTINVTTVQ